MKSGVFPLAVTAMLGLSLYAAAADNKWESGHPLEETSSPSEPKMVPTANRWNRGFFDGPSQRDTPKWEVGLHPMIAIPTRESKDILKSSLGIQASVDYKCHDMFTVGAELGYSFGHKVEGTILGTGTGFTTDMKLKILQVTPTVKFGKTFDAGYFEWTPYGVLGAGLYAYKGQTGTFAMGTYATSLKIKQATDFGYNLGGGVSVPIKQFSVGFDFRYHRAIEPGDDITYITPSIRLSYLF